jgi:aryl-alcohol dehydrogenase-like predicted oxidoreductase
MDYVDVVFAHLFEASTPMEEVCRAFNQVIEDGHAFYWATSNWPTEKVVEAITVCKRLKLAAPICG